MNVDMLRSLADVVCEECYSFGSIRLGFTMNTTFEEVSKLKPYSFVQMTDNRFENSVLKPTHIGCLMAFTMFLNKTKEKLPGVLEEDFVVENAVIESAHILDLDNVTANELFLGDCSSSMTGESASRVIRKLLITGEVDWFLPYR